MRVVIATVPLATPFAPALGAPLVAAELQARGHDARVVDGALLALETLWSRPRIARGLEHLRALLGRHERHDSLTRSALVEYQQAAQAVLGAERVLEGLDRALATLRGQGEGRVPAPAAYDAALELLLAALRLASAPHAPERATLTRYQPPAPLRSVDDLLAHARRSEDEALFGATLLRALPAALLEGGGVDLVGVSITFPEQLGPAAMLGRGLRAHGYQGPIAWGGALMAHLADDLARAPQLRQQGLVDVVIPHPGVEPLLAWLDAGGGEAAVDGALVPGRPWTPAPRDAASHAAWVEALPAPRFDDLPLARYLSPRPVLPVLSTLGCYHQRCTFCDHFHSVCRYRPRRARAVLDELRTLHVRYACCDFYLVDDCTPPRLLGELAAGLQQWRDEGGPALRWITESRAERALLRPGLLDALAASGCRMLLFGLESADDGVLTAMAKGTDRATLAQVLAAVHGAGIGVWCFYMVGYPAEDAAAAQATHDFLVEQRAHIDLVAGGPFVVTRHSPVGRDPAAHGLRVRVDTPRKGRPAPPRLELLLPHQGGRLSEAQQGRALRALLDDARLQHWRHPLVVEAHALFLGRDYYHAEPPAPVALPRRYAELDRQALAAWTVQPLPGLSVQYFRFPTRTDQVPPTGKVVAQPLAVLHDLASGRQREVSVPVGALVERCLAGAASVEQRVQQTLALGQGERDDVIDAIVALLEAGLLVVTPPATAPAA